MNCGGMIPGHVDLSVRQNNEVYTRLVKSDVPIRPAAAGNAYELDGTYDLVKLPHHGSVRNISEEWSQKINCRNYMICTDGFSHPDKQTIAKLLQWYGEIHVYGSVDWWSRFLLDEDKACNVHFAEGEKILWKVPMRS